MFHRHSKINDNFPKFDNEFSFLIRLSYCVYCITIVLIKREIPGETNNGWLKRIQMLLAT